MSSEHSISCKWKSGMAFDAEFDGHAVKIDASEDHGGSNYGILPKPLLLIGLAGCTGMDVVSILKKMHVEYNTFNVFVNGDLTEEHPKVYNKIHLIYEFSGNDLNMKSIEKAVLLSQEKYCGVSAMLRQAAKLTYEIKIV